jgi:HSP20 family protein
MLVRWTPFTETARLTSAMNRLFDAGYAGAAWTPAIDVAEDADKITLTADLPGMTQAGLDIQIDKDVLTLRGERKLEREAEGEHYRRYERVSGSFARSFQLPPTVDTEGVSASMKDGVLTLVLPKRAEAKPRQIKVNVQ